jgi:ubiquinone/menaquinone biosynthesis C-methylase UbiE
MDFDKGLYKTYAMGRRLSPSCLYTWVTVIGKFLPDRPDLTALDLGSGTGRFSLPMAERLGLTVVGVEPSEKMRNEALAHGRHPRVTYLEGCAEAIPCADGSFDVAFLSMILHHIEDPPMACRELARVVKPEGVVMVRNAFANRLYAARFYEFFPAAKKIDDARMPKIQEVVAAFEAAGLRCAARREVTQHIDDSLAAHCERMKLRAASTFELMSDEDFHAGITAMEEAARSEAEPLPVTETIDFLVFRRKKGD